MQSAPSAQRYGQVERPTLGTSWLWPICVLLALLVGFAAAWLWPRQPGANSPEVTFAHDMSVHHAQAVEMALVLRDKTGDEQLRAFATDIVLTQQAQIGQMQGWLALWNQPLASADAPMGGMGEQMGMASDDQLAALRDASGVDAETLFLQLMIRHHQGGVLMAEDVLQHTDQPSVQRLAQSIVNGQQAEIDAMRFWLEQRGTEPLPAVEPIDQMEHGGH